MLNFQLGHLRNPYKSRIYEHYKLNKTTLLFRNGDGVLANKVLNVMFNGVNVNATQQEDGYWLIQYKKDGTSEIVSDEEFQVSQERLGEEHDNMWADACDPNDYYMESNDEDWSSMIELHSNK